MTVAPRRIGRQSAHRVELIRARYTLTQETRAGTFHGHWTATWHTPYDTIQDSYTGKDKAAVCGLARTRWGGFAHDDEAEVFAEIFPHPTIPVLRRAPSRWRDDHHCSW